MANQYVQTQVVCANCAAIRGETNRWWAITPWDKPAGSWPAAILIVALHDAKDDFLPACGELCLLRLVAKNLEKL